MATFDEIIKSAIGRDKLHELDEEALGYYKRGLALGVYNLPPRLQEKVDVPVPEVDRKGTPFDLYVDKDTGLIRPSKWGPHSDMFRAVEAQVSQDPGLQMFESRRFRIDKTPVMDYYARPVGSRGEERIEYDITSGRALITKKKGHKGWLNMTDGSNRKVADYEWDENLYVNGISQTYPLITPHSTQKEIDWLLSGGVEREPDNPLTRKIIEDAQRFARSEILKGRSPFKGGFGAGGMSPIKAYAYMNSPEGIKNEKYTSKTGALLRGIGEGFTVELPRMTGQMLKFLGMKEVGNILTNWADTGAEKLWGPKPDYDEFTRWFYEAGIILPTSGTPMGLSMTGARILLKVGLRLTQVEKASEAIFKANARYQASLIGEGTAAGKAAIKASQVKIIKPLVATRKVARRELKTAQQLVNRITQASVAGFFGLSTAQTTKETAWDRIQMLEDQGDFAGARAIRRILWWAPFLTGLIEGTGEYFGTRYLARLFMVPEGEILAKTSHGWLTEHLLKIGKVMGVEMGTEGVQQFGIATTEKLTDIRPEAQIWAEVVSVFGPAGVAALLMGGVGGLSTYPRAREAIKRHKEKQEELKEYRDSKDEQEAYRQTFEKYNGLSTQELGAALEERGIRAESYEDHVDILLREAPGDIKEAVQRGYMVMMLAKLTKLEITNPKELARRIVIDEILEPLLVARKEKFIPIFDFLGPELKMIIAKQHGIAIENEDGTVRSDKEITDDIRNKYISDHPNILIEGLNNTSQELEDNQKDNAAQTISDRFDGVEVSERPDVRLFLEREYDPANPSYDRDSLIKFAKILGVEEKRAEGMSNESLHHHVFVLDMLRPPTRSKILVLVREEMEKKGVPGAKDSTIEEIFDHFLTGSFSTVNNLREYINTLVKNEDLVINKSDGSLHVPLRRNVEPVIPMSTLIDENGRPTEALVSLYRKTTEIREWISKKMNLLNKDNKPMTIMLKNALYLLEDLRFVRNYEDLYRYMWPMEDSLRKGENFDNIPDYYKEKQINKEVNEIEKVIPRDELIEGISKILGIETVPVASKSKRRSTSARVARSKDTYPLFSAFWSAIESKINALEASKKSWRPFTKTLSRLHGFLEKNTEMRDILLDNDGTLRKFTDIASDNWEKFGKTWTTYLEADGLSNNSSKKASYMLGHFFNRSLGWPELRTTMSGTDVKLIFDSQVKSAVGKASPHQAATALQLQFFLDRAANAKEAFKKESTLRNSVAYYNANRDLLVFAMYRYAGIKPTEIQWMRQSSVSDPGKITIYKSKTPAGVTTIDLTFGREAFASILSGYREASKAFWEKFGKVGTEKDAFLFSHVRIDVNNNITVKELLPPSVTLILFKDYYLKSIDMLLLRDDLTSEERMQLEEKKNYGEEMFKQHTYRHGLVFVFNLRGDLSEGERAYLFRWASETQNAAYRQQTAAIKIIIQGQRDSLLRDLKYKKEGALIVKYPKENGIKKWIEDNNINIFFTKEQHTFIAPEVSSFIRENVFIIQKKDDTLAYVWDEGNKLYEIEPKDLDRVTSSPLEFKLLFEQLEGNKTTIEVKETGVAKKAKSTKETVSVKKKPAKKTPAKKKAAAGKKTKVKILADEKKTGGERQSILAKFIKNIKGIIAIKLKQRNKKGEKHKIPSGLFKNISNVLEKFDELQLTKYQSSLVKSSDLEQISKELDIIVENLQSFKGPIDNTSLESLKMVLENVSSRNLNQLRELRDILHDGVYNKELFELDRPKFEALIKVLGIKNVELIFDPKSPLVGLININSKEGQQMLRDQGWEENRIEEARKRGAEIYRCGVYQCIFKGKNEGRVVITLGHGADISTVLHEIAHAFIQQGGEVKGITDRLTRGEVANEEWMARELAIKWGREVKSKGVLSGIKKLGKATGKVNINYYISRPMFIAEENKKDGVTIEEALVPQLAQLVYRFAGLPVTMDKDTGKANEFMAVLEGSPQNHQDLHNAIESSYQGKNGMAVTEEEFLKNASWASKLRNYPKIKAIIDFLLPLGAQRESMMVEAARMAKSGILARGLEMTNRLTKVLKVVAADKVSVFFDYVDGKFDNPWFRRMMQALEVRMVELNKQFNDKKRYEIKIEELKSGIKELDKGDKNYHTKKGTMEIKIEGFEKDIGKLKLEEVNIFPEAADHQAVTLKNNPTHEQVIAAGEKVFKLMERAYWAYDGIHTIKAAIGAGMPNDLKKIAQEMKKLQLQMGKELLKHGHIDRNSYWKWYGRYIHYMYLRNLVDYKPFGSAYMKAEAGAKMERLAGVGTHSGMLEHRENLSQIEKQQIAHIKDIRTVIPIGFAETISVLANDKYFNLLKDPRMGVIVPFNKMKGPVKTEKGWVIEYKIPDVRTTETFKSERLDKLTNEKVDKVWFISIKNKERVYHFHIDELADEISMMEGVIKKLKKDKTIAGFSAADRKQHLVYLNELKAAFAPVKEYLDVNFKEDLRKNYVRVGDKYGDISNEYLNKAVYDDLTPLISPEAHQGEVYMQIMKWNAQVTMAFKAGKVAINPPTMFRNLISNILQNNMRGRPLPHCLLDFMKALTSAATKDKWWQEARDIGLFRGNMMKAEAQEALDHFKKAEAHTTWFKFMNWVSKSTHLYGKIDETAKLAIYRQLREKGHINRVGLALSGKPVNPYEAAVIASRWGMDYSQASRSIKHLRQQVSPFVTYQYKILPMILETLAHRPWILIKWVGFLGVGTTSWGFQGIAQTLSQSLLGMDDEEWKKMLKQLPDFILENNTFIPLPWKSKDGKVMWFDGLYFMPFGTWYATLKDLSKVEVAEAFKNAGISNPFLTAWYALNSGTRDKPPTDPFTKQPIFNKLDSPIEQFIKILSWTHNIVTPGAIENFMIPEAHKRGALVRIFDVEWAKLHNEDLRDKWNRRLGREQLLTILGIMPHITWGPQTIATRKAKRAFYMKELNRKLRTLHPVKDRGKIIKIRKRFHKEIRRITKADVGYVGRGVYNR